VVAQVNISAVVAIKRYVPEIQEKLRGCGYPGFTSTQVPELIFGTSGSQPMVQPLSRFEFLDREERTGIVLTTKSVAIHTNRYTSFEEFSKTISMALEIVNSVAKLQLQERIGLRYIDLIELGSGEKQSDYLAKHLLGYDPLAVGVSESIFNFRFEGSSQYGQLVARHYNPQIDNMFPPDLAGISLDYSHRDVPMAGTASILDFDHSTIEKKDFAESEILQTLEELHDGVDILFRNSVTEHALKQWGSHNATVSSS
jgi:uncharacterized protein (TIGR04255 family)